MLTSVLGSIRTADAGQPVSAKKAGRSLTVHFKGQWAYLQPSQTYPAQAVCLKHHNGDMMHDVWFFILESNAQQRAGVKPQTIKDGNRTWFGWKLEKGGQVSTSGMSIPAESQFQRAPRLKTRYWPNNVNSDSDWETQEWIPEITEIAPKAKLNRMKLDEERWITVTLPALGGFTAEKPCRPEDIGAVWKWEGPQGINPQDPPHQWIKAATDRVRYTSITSFAETPGFTLPEGIEIVIKGEGEVPILFLCAPDLKQPVRQYKKGYKPGYQVEHFKKVFRILDGSEMADMTYLFPSTQGEIKEGTCPKPFVERDDDIFCPGSSIPQP